MRQEEIGTENTDITSTSLQRVSLRELSSRRRKRYKQLECLFKSVNSVRVVENLFEIQVVELAHLYRNVKVIMLYRFHLRQDQ